ncbi:MAG: hypothetical protein R3F34_07425 [Planctomycetota bacterium]
MVLLREDGGAPCPETRAEFVARATDLAVRVDWTPTEDPLGAGVTGDVVEPVRAEGLHALKGLWTHDPEHEQYQLWIIDAAREGEHPVDGRRSTRRATTRSSSRSTRSSPSGSRRRSR